MNMASLFNLSTPFCTTTTTTFTKAGYAKVLRSQSPPINTSLNPARLITCTSNISKETKIVPRRSANYPATLWDDRFIQSLTSDYSDETHKKKAEELKKEVSRLIIERAARPLDQVELIDDLQRLGLSYHFEDIIETTLRNIYVKCNYDHSWKDFDLHVTSIHFRLFRDHNFHVPQDVFFKFTDESGYLNTSLSSDIKGLLSLYEASHLSIEGETMLEHARDFSTQHLASHLKNGKMNDDDIQTMQVKNALEVPLHWRMLRNQARWFIEIYEQRPDDVNPILLQLAKLDFNIVQAGHQNDLKILSRWWKKLGLAQKAPFARERLFESFCGAMGSLFEPQEGCWRQILAKTYVIITLLDDMCDVYATFDELVLFTDAVKRWDINTLDELPEYMRICYLALFNTVNDMAYEVLKDHGYNPISQLKKSWGDLFESYIIEMRWYHGGDKPSLDEYLNVAWYSFSTPVSLAHVLFSASKYPISKDVLECLELSSSSSSSSSNSVIRLCSVYLRLWDDLATSSDEMKRGDVPKSIQCYMNETGATEEEARAHIKSLLSQILKKMNKARFEEESKCGLSKKFIALLMNMCRMTIFVYQHGDAFGNSNNLLKDGVLKLLVKPI